LAKNIFYILQEGGSLNNLAKNIFYILELRYYHIIGIKSEQNQSTKSYVIKKIILIFKKDIASNY